MKLYDFGPAANAKRVRIYLAEKGLSLPTETVNVRDGAMYEEPYASMNPFAVVPFMELDDGTILGESIAICRYLEELHPEPNLFGRTAAERAVIEMWNRRLEMDAFIPLGQAARNSNPMFAGRVVAGTRTDLPQLPELAERGKAAASMFLERLDKHLQNSDFVAGAEFSVADITGHMVMQSAHMMELPVLATLANVARWREMVAARPSMDA